MSSGFLVKKNKETIESLQEGIDKKRQEFKSLLNLDDCNVNEEMITSEKAIEFFKARPELIGDDLYKIREYRLYLAKKIRRSILWDYKRLRECQESKETKARCQIEKKNQ